MMQTTVGVDLVPVARMQRLLDEQPDIKARLFTQRERDYCDAKRRAAQHYAARFAAKEAVLKAFGTGLGTDMNWTDVEVVNDPSGRPRARLHGTLAQLAGDRGLAGLDISLSHTDTLAVAQAVALFSPAGQEERDQ